MRRFIMLKDGKINYNYGVPYFDLCNISIKKIYHYSYNVRVDEGSEDFMILVIGSL